jgi:hypothetical protein
LQFLIFLLFSAAYAALIQNYCGFCSIGVFVACMGNFDGFFVYGAVGLIMAV